MEDLTIAVPSEPLSAERAPWFVIRADQIRQIAAFVADDRDDETVHVQIRGQGYFFVLWAGMDDDTPPRQKTVFPLPN